MNIDGSSNGNPGHASGGMVIRDSSGSILLAEAFYFGITTSFNAETMSFLQGLQLCALNGLFSMAIEIDSKSLVDNRPI